MTVASGSPAFADLVARRDAFSIERLRAAGCILIGLTNMPPMANGGMQRGLYGRAESPYNADYLTSAFGSGSSNGSGTATAAIFAAFGLGEETWSSGRAPASNNALCAYTPSRGVISVRGNWPLVPTMDVVVPHTRTMADLLEVLDVIVADDADSRGDFWRTQPWVPIPRASAVRPDSYPALAEGAASALAGRRFGIPAMYLGEDPDAGTGRGIGASTGSASSRAPSVLDLWAQREGRPRGGRRRGRGRGLPRRQQLRGRPRRSALDHRSRHRAGRVLRRRDLGAVDVVVARLPRRERAAGAVVARRGRRSRRSSRSPRARSPTATATSTSTSRSTSRAPARDGITDPFDGPLAPSSSAPGVEGLEQTRIAWTSRSGCRSSASTRCLPRGRRRRTRRCRRQRGVRGRRVAQRGLGRQRQPRDPAPRHPDGDRADGHDGRHRDAGRSHVRGRARTPTAICCAGPPPSSRCVARRTAPPRTPEL